MPTGGASPHSFRDYLGERGVKDLRFGEQGLWEGLGFRVWIQGFANRARLVGTEALTLNAKPRFSNLLDVGFER